MRCFLKILLFLFMIISIFTVGVFQDQIPKYEKIANKITKKTAEKIEEEKNLVLVGIGGRMMRDIQMMAMSFNYYQEINLEQARRLLIYVVNEYLNAINSSEDVRPYLHEYPFTPRNVEIRILIYNSDRYELTPDKISYVSYINGILSYYTGSDDNHLICTENYDEALDKIASCQ